MFRTALPAVRLASLCCPARSASIRILVSPSSNRSRTLHYEVSPFRPKSLSRFASPFTMRSYATKEEVEAIRDARQEAYRKRNHNLFLYTASVIVIFLGASYAAVPLYKAFCSATGFAGTPKTGTGKFEPERLVPVAGAKPIKVQFNTNTSEDLPWSFTPQQKYLYVVPGETALAFYTAKNKSDKDIIGIATYNVTPDRVAPYFAKVECFCFEEQKLLAGEEIDLPLFFFIDKDSLDDPVMDGVDNVILSYTFFRARRNKQGHLEPDASEADVDRSMGWSDYSKAPKAEDREKSS